MKNGCFLVLFLVLFYRGPAQSVASTLQKAVQHLAADTQLRHGSVGFWVMDTKTGKTVFAKNEAAKRFYYHFDFEPSSVDSMHLYLILKDNIHLIKA